MALATRRVLRIVVAVLLVEVAGLAAWRACDAWRAGRVVLTTDGPPLTVQVLGESDDTPIGEPVELLRRATLTLPSGDYRLRVAGEGRLGRTYRCAVVRGESSTRTLTLDDNRLLGETPIPPGWTGMKPRKDPIPFVWRSTAIELTPGKADLIEVASELPPGKDALAELLPSRFGRRDGATGMLIWDALEPGRPGKPARAYHPWVEWLATNPGNQWLIDPAPDIDGDGTRDLVWVSGSDFLAVSGKDGSVLWTYQAEPDGPGGPHPEGPERPGQVRHNGNIGDPATADLDRDGVPDIIAIVVFQPPTQDLRGVVVDALAPDGSGSHEYLPPRGRRRLGPVGATIVGSPARRRFQPGVAVRSGEWDGVSPGAAILDGGDHRPIRMDRARPGGRAAADRPDRSGPRAGPARPVRRPRRRRRARDPRDWAGHGEHPVADCFLHRGRSAALVHDDPLVLRSLLRRQQRARAGGRPRRRRPRRGRRARRLRPGLEGRLSRRPPARRRHGPPPLDPADAPPDAGRGRGDRDDRGARPRSRRRPRPRGHLALPRPTARRPQPGRPGRAGAILRRRPLRQGRPAPVVVAPRPGARPLGPVDATKVVGPGPGRLAPPGRPE